MKALNPRDLRITTEYQRPKPLCHAASLLEVNLGVVLFDTLVIPHETEKTRELASAQETEPAVVDWTQKTGGNRALKRTHVRFFKL